MTTERSRTIEWPDPAPIAAAASGRTGLEFLRAMLKGSVSPPPIGVLMGFALEHVGEGVARFRGQASEPLYNPMGTVHGGVAATLLDSAMGSAVMTTCDARTAYTTVDLVVHLTRPITLRTGALVAEGRIAHRGSRVATATGELRDVEGRLLAHGSTTCLLFER